METVKVSTNQHIDIDYPVAGIGERVSARLIDLGLFLGIFIVFAIFFGITGMLSNNEFASNVMLAIYAFGFVFYDLLCEIFLNGQSIGKTSLKIRVISLDGSQPTIGQYFIRWVFRLVDFVLASPVGGLVCVAVTENKQRIGDLVAGTTLIKTEPRTKLENIAFHPVQEDYTLKFPSVNLLSDRDIELIHEVLETYYKIGNADLIYQLAGKVAGHIGVTNTEGLNELDFLKTVISDYNHLTSRTL